MHRKPHVLILAAAVLAACVAGAGCDRLKARDRLNKGVQAYKGGQFDQAIEDFKASSWIGEILGSDVQGRFADLKQAAANRSPRELGTFVKDSEVQYHHEVYNQSLWNLF